ncbi:MAG: AMP-dependent synthetase and ligase [Bryobacterales bacterium]|nr:AMP-dependent synthetase and ligase [Bryobacterales bacterium]
MARDTLVDFFTDHFFDDLGALKGEFVVYDNGYRPQSYRYREIAGMARAFALRLRASGILKGDKVLIWSENRPGWIAALWGCILDGIILVPLDYRVSAEFLLRISGLVGAKVLLTGDEVSPPADFAAPVWRLAEIERQSAETLDPAVAVGENDTVEIVFTSGATAEPKGVIITHRNLLANMVPVEREINRYKQYGRPFFPLRFLNMLPLSHLFGQAMATYIPPMLGGVVIFMQGFAPGEIVRQIHDRRVSVLVCVPKMLEVLRGYVTSRFPEAADTGSHGPWWVRWWRYRRVHRALGLKFWAFVVGAAPLDSELEQFWSKLGFLVIQGYGLTETAPIVTLNHPFHAQKGTVGRPIAGVEVKIAADGEILVRGPNVTSGYYDVSDADSQMFENGWLHTGDLGELAHDGSLIVRGRKKDVIVTPEGLNVYPEDIERILDQIPGVKEAAVVGPDRPHAVLVLEPGTNPGEVVNVANQKLEEHQRVRTVHVWPGESLPRTEGTAKLKRIQIREWLTTGAPQQAAPGREGGVLELLRDLAPGRTITPDTTLEELGLSSLERVELLSGIEQRLGGARDEAAFAGAQRVSDLLKIPPAPHEAAEDYPRWSRSLPARLWRRIFLPAAVFPLTRYYARIEVRGREHLSGLSGPVIFASNHQSHMDAPAIMIALAGYRYRVAPAMSKEFFDAHFHPARHGWSERFVRSLQYYLAVLCFNAFPLPQRESGVGGALRYAGELAANRWSILIFPEGERTDHGEILPFQPGVALMASRLSLPIVPVRLRGLEKVLHKHARRATPGPVQISFGPPINLPVGDLRDLASQVQGAVERL